MKPVPAGRVAAAVLFLLLTAVFPSQPRAADAAPEDRIAALEADSAKAFEDNVPLRAYNANMKLLRLRPYEAEYMVNVVRAAALMGRRSVAYDFMLQMQQQGLSHDFNQEPDSESIRNSEAYDYINELLVEAGKAAGEGSTIFELPKLAGDLGAMAWDESRKRWLLGTLSEGKLLAVGDDGQVEVLLEGSAENGPWSIGGLAVDAVTGRIWVASSETPKFQGYSPVKKSGHAVFEYKLDSLEPVARHDLSPDQLDHDLGSIAVTGDGFLYVIDRAQPIVFRLEPGGKALVPFVASPELVRLTDLAVTPDNSRVFASDIAKGIWVIDPVAEQAGMLAGPETLNLGGITGLAYRNGQLFVIQGAQTPQRLLRLELDATGSQAAEVTPMAIALDRFDGPGVGSIREDGLFYVANAHSSTSGATARVMRTPLDAGDQIESPTIRQFQREMENKQNQ
ncbi:MAG: hypothetical protein HKP03_06230 [Xanthomonadales bacterium]|nr:hypothetical protein [Gammaproteobacteria bacterium]NNK38059.1 hypothetical protein [Xanthomonadales bacterium]